MKQKLACLFHKAENVHLTKDIGMIPFLLQKHFNFDTTLICYENGKYPNLEKDVKGLKLVFIKKITGNTNLDTYLFLIQNANKYDIFQIYHPTIYNLLFLALFKFLNFYKSNKTYLKLDANETIFRPNGYSKIKQKLLYFLMKFANVISVETTFLYNKLVKLKPYKNKLIYLPNGYYPKRTFDLSEKENTMICVGIVGSIHKSSDILMAGFEKFYQTNKNWKLKFIGPIVESFQPTIHNYFKEHPQLIEVINFVGNIENKEMLFEEYKKAKVLISSSNSESFGMVFTEAMNFGCRIITSRILSSQDVTNHGKTGEVFPIGDSVALANAMITMDSKLNNISEADKNAYNDLRDQFYWKDILETLNEKLK